MDNTLYPQFLQSIRTITEQQELIQEIEVLRQSLYQQNQAQFLEALHVIPSPSLQTLLTKLFIASKNKTIDFAAIRSFFDVVSSDMHKLPIVQLTIAFVPNAQTISVFSGWVKMNVDQRAVLDIKQDQSILGGAVISYKGNYFDQTMVKTVQNVFAQRKEAIEQLLSG